MASLLQAEQKQIEEDERQSEEQIYIIIDELFDKREQFLNNFKLSLCDNFDLSMGLSAELLEEFLNNRISNESYKYTGCDFDDFQRAAGVIVRNHNKIFKIQNNFFWKNVCNNLEICAYLVWFWRYFENSDERKLYVNYIYKKALEGYEKAKLILTIPGYCRWDEWKYILQPDKCSWNSKIHEFFTIIIDKIQYNKSLTQEENKKAESMIKTKYDYVKEYSFKEIYYLMCYLNNNNIEGNLTILYDDSPISREINNNMNNLHIEHCGTSISKVIYRNNSDTKWFNPYKFSDEKAILLGYLEIE